MQILEPLEHLVIIPRGLDGVGTTTFALDVIKHFNCKCYAHNTNEYNRANNYSSIITCNMNEFLKTIGRDNRNLCVHIIGCIDNFVTDDIANEVIKMIRRIKNNSIIVTYITDQTPKYYDKYHKLMKDVLILSDIVFSHNSAIAKYYDLQNLNIKTIPTVLSRKRKLFNKSKNYICFAGRNSVFKRPNKYFEFLQKFPELYSILLGVPDDLKLTNENIPTYFSQRELRATLLKADFFYYSAFLQQEIQSIEYALFEAIEFNCIPIIPRDTFDVLIYYSNKEEKFIKLKDIEQDSLKFGIILDDDIDTLKRAFADNEFCENLRKNTDKIVELYINNLIFIENEIFKLQGEKNGKNF